MRRCFKIKKQSYFDNNYTIRVIPQKIAKSYIKENHYLHSYPAGCVNLGLYNGDELIGVIVYGMSCQAKMAASIIPILGQQDYYELQRLHIMDCTRSGAESWFIAKSIEWLKVNRPNVVMLVSFSDLYEGHQGTVYQATNFLFVGKNKGGKIYIDNNGRIVNARTIAKGKVDVSTLNRVWRPGKNRYIKLLVKGINVYKHKDTGEIIRENNLQNWLEREKEDKRQYIVRDHNNYLRKYKYNLAKGLRYDILEYPPKSIKNNEEE